MDRPWDIKVYPQKGSELVVSSFNNLPSLAIASPEQTDELEVLDPPIPLSDKEESIWRRDQVSDRSAHLFLIGSILKSHGLREDLIVEALAHHPLSIDKYIGRTMKEAARIVEKLKTEPGSEELVRKMLIWNWLDFMTHPTHVSWMVENSWIDRSVGFISGPPKSYKSWTALDLAISIASGTLFLDTFRTLKSGPVVIIQEEDPHSVIQERLALIGEHKGLSSISRMKQNSLGLEFPELPIFIINLQGFRLEDTEKVQQFLREIRIINPALVILDPFINVAREDLDEYRGIQVANTLQGIKIWREEYNCGVVIVHHWNKNEGSNVGGTRMYGSFAFHAWLESALHIRPQIQEDEETKEIVIEREFKAAEAGHAIRVQFDIDTREGFRYIPSVVGVSRSSPQGILEIIKENSGISHADLAKKTNQKPRAFTRLMAKMLQEGAVVAKKEGRIATYSLPES